MTKVRAMLLGLVVLGLIAVLFFTKMGYGTSTSARATSVDHASTHATGSQWTIASPIVPPGAHLTAISAAAKWDAWVAGSTPTGSLIEHWDGLHWQIVNATPQLPAPWQATFTGMHAYHYDVWAYGFATNRNQPANVVPFVLYFNGGSWSVTLLNDQFTSPATTGSFTSILQTSPGDAWAVVQETMRANNQVKIFPNIERFNGTTWKPWPQQSIIRSAGPGPVNGILSDMAETSLIDIWAVGADGDGFGDPLLAHYDGKSWGPVAGAPDTQNVFNGQLKGQFTSIDAMSANDIWAVGAVTSTTGTTKTTLIEHWDGQAWKLFSSNINTIAGQSVNLFKVMEFDPTNVVIVGSVTQAHSTTPIVLQASNANGGSVKRVPTPAFLTQIGKNGFTVAPIPGTNTYWLLSSTGSAAYGN